MSKRRQGVMGLLFCFLVLQSLFCFNSWTGNVVQMVELLPSNCEALSSNPSTAKKGGRGRKEGRKEGKKECFNS
jgi:hypothetical protein